MLSPTERKKSSFAKSLLHGAELKKYEEIYQQFMQTGYTKELCETYADEFINNVKKPAPADIVQTAALYDRIHDSKSALFYLDMLADKKLSGDDRFNFCLEMLKSQSKIGHWRDAEDFRTDNINFLQNYVQKKSQQHEAKLYIALALVDCASKKYTDAFKLLGFGYKPQGKNDTTLLEMFISAAYIYSQSGDKEELENAVATAHACLKLFTEFEFSWSKKYYEKRIAEAAEGIL